MQVLRNISVRINIHIKIQTNKKIKWICVKKHWSIQMNWLQRDCHSTETNKRYYLQYANQQHCLIVWWYVVVDGPHAHLSTTVVKAKNERRSDWKSYFCQYIRSLWSLYFIIDSRLFTAKHCSFYCYSYHVAV